MERIRKAMERLAAPADRQPGVRPAAGRAEASTSASRPAPEPVESLPSDGAIVYTRTKVAPTSRRRAVRSRLVVATGDPRAFCFQVLRTQLLHLCRARRWSTLGVTSVRSGAGKTFVAANLAISIANEPNQTVVLVDLDLRHPRVAKVFGYRAKSGIGDCLLGDRPIEDVLFNPGIDRLVVLPGAKTHQNPSELLASKSTRQMFREMVARYQSRMILCDLVPLTAADDVLVCLPYLDAIVLVAEYGRTTRHDIEHSMEFLRDMPIAAVVMNKVSHPGSPDEFYDYTYR